jgi:hypothetical protein
MSGNLPPEEGNYPSQEFQHRPDVNINVNRHHPLMRVGAAATAGAIIGVGAFVWLNRGESTRESVTEQRQTMTAYGLAINVDFAEIDTESTFKINQELSQEVGVWPLKHNFQWHNYFTSEVPGFIDLGITGSGVRMSSDTNALQPPKPGDTVEINVDRSQLLIQAAGILPNKVEGQSDTVTVLDGKDVAYDGEPVPLKLQHQMIAKDGIYKLGIANFGGKDSNVSSFMESLHLGRVDYSAHSHTTEVALGTLLLSNPSCIRAAQRILSLDDAVKTAFDNDFLKQGYKLKNIHITETGSWPAADEIPNEYGETYKSETTPQSIRDTMKQMKGTKTLQVSQSCPTETGVGIKPTNFTVGPVPTKKH